ncbi:MFS transporter [Candidatus Bipolaricaulota bacterium]
MPQASPRTLAKRLRDAAESYPRSYWAMLGGFVVGFGGINVIWPFISMYARRAFDVPLTKITIVFTLYSVISAFATTLAGPIVDRLGRKLGLVMAFVASAILLFVMGMTHTYPTWVALMLAWALFWPFIQISSNAMVADWVPEDRRMTAYAMIIISISAGIALGPAIGGFIIERSYVMAFTIAAIAAAVTALIIQLFVRESLVRAAPATSSVSETQAQPGYRHILKHPAFVGFCGVYAVHALCGVMMFMLLPLYINEQFGVPESRTGFIMSAGAMMPVLFQYVAARFSSRFNSLRVMAVGAGCYVLAFLIIALGRSFWPFLAGFCTLQMGLLITVPTASALTANAARPTMRGRYMSAFSLASWVGFGLGPLVGGLLNDHIAPVAMWYGGMAISLVAMVGYLALVPAFRRDRHQETPLAH